jgi:hypothetical protein
MSGFGKREVDAFAGGQDRVRNAAKVRMQVLLRFRNGRDFCNIKSIVSQTKARREIFAAGFGALSHVLCSR